MTERGESESCITSTCLSAFHQPRALTERYDEICDAHFIHVAFESGLENGIGRWTTERTETKHRAAPD